MVHTAGLRCLCGTSRKAPSRAAVAELGLLQRLGAAQRLRVGGVVGFAFGSVEGGAPLVVLPAGEVVEKRGEEHGLHATQHAAQQGAARPLHRALGHEPEGQRVHLQVHAQRRVQRQLLLLLLLLLVGAGPRLLRLAPREAVGHGGGEARLLQDARALELHRAHLQRAGAAAALHAELAHGLHLEPQQLQPAHVAPEAVGRQLLDLAHWVGEARNNTSCCQRSRARER
eukprot:scaffold2857_cov399-Prasinococcus_capsulatus_cf.AAC.2